MEGVKRARQIAPPPCSPETHRRRQAEREQEQERRQYQLGAYLRRDVIRCIVVWLPYRACFRFRRASRMWRDVVDDMIRTRPDWALPTFGRWYRQTWPADRRKDWPDATLSDV